jgi:CRP-like cAMP-binding protein
MKKHLVPRRISPSLMAETRNMLSGIAPVETYAAGRILLSDDSQSRWVYWLDQGLVKLTSLDSRGCEGIVGVRGPGAFLGETSTLIEERDSVTPVTLTECQLNRIPAKMFLNQAPWLFRSNTGREPLQIRDQNPRLLY